MGEEAPGALGERVLQVGGAGGPYRAALQIAAAPPPKHFYVRDSGDELVIERRWFLSLSTARRLGVFTLILVAMYVRHSSHGLWVAYAAALAAAALGAALAWRRTTLTLNPHHWSLVRGYFVATQRFRGALSDLQLGEITSAVEDPSRGGPPGLGMAMHFGAERTTIFDQAPREHLEWAHARITAWSGRLRRERGR